jgi:hypothetical protein
MEVEQEVCGDPGLAIRDTWYAYNSRSHDQYIVNPHIRVDNRITSSITILHSRLTTGHMTKLDNATQGKFTTKQWTQSIVDDPCYAYYPTGNWLEDVPSLHRRRRSHHHLPHSRLPGLTKLIARDKAMSKFWIILANHLKGESLICSMAVAMIGSSLVYFLWKQGFLVSI